MMQTETIVEIETVVDDLTDHEFDITCEDYTVAGGVRVGGDCDRPARWIFYKAAHCHYALTHPSLFCDVHKEVRFLPGSETECLGCGLSGPPGVMYSHVEPLTRKS